MTDTTKEMVDAQFSSLPPAIKAMIDRRALLKKMRKMAEDIAEYNDGTVIMATIKKIEVELLYLKLELNCAY